MSADGQQTLNDVCEFIVDCLHKTAPIQEDGYPSIRTPNVGRGRLILDGVNRVSQAVYDEWTKRAVPEPGDLILAREAPAGNVAIIKEGQTVCLGQRTVHLRPDSSKVDPDFLCYYLLAPKQQGALLAGETGATAGHVNMRDIRRLKLGKLPEKPAQEKAAQIIAAYDDLIENNLRRIVLLEQAARMLYREWFVHFRFPGHEHVEIIDSLPKGWERRSLVQLTTKIGSGATPTGGEASYKESGISLIRSQNVYDYRFDFGGLAFIDEEQAHALSNVEVEAGDVLLNITGASVGRCCLAPRRVVPARVNQHVMIVRAEREKVSPQFLLHAINSHNNKERLLNIARAAGATREALTKDVVSGFTITVPSRKLLGEFASVIDPICSQRELLEASSQKLACARDLLLPRLMNGEIAV